MRPRLQQPLIRLLKPPPSQFPLPINAFSTLRHHSTISPLPPAPVLTSTAASLRNTMRLLPHPVSILTSAATPTSPGVGITLSSLTCLSLYPTPLVTFNIKLPSSCSAAMHASGMFVTHVMAPTRHAAHLANVFAQVGKKERSPWRELHGADKRDRGEWGVPTLGRGEGVVRRLVCEKVQTVVVQDHEIWVGRVLRVEGEEDGEGEGEFGLMYANRGFRAVGAEIKAEYGEHGRVRGDGSEEYL